jgi:hypothetical protein
MVVPDYFGSIMGNKDSHLELQVEGNRGFCYVFLATY